MTTDPQPPTVPPVTSNEIPRESARTILFQFVVFPLGIVAIGVLIFLLFGMMASEEHSVRDYVNDIRSGSSHQRWQAAYQLSKSLKRGEGRNDPALVSEVASLYRRSAGDDPKVRRYLGMVLGQLGDRSVTPMLLDSLSGPDTENRIFTLLALGELGDPAAVPRIIEFASSEESDLRKSAVYALGAIGDRRAIPVLTEKLEDPVPDVRWNAALSLSRFGERSAVPVLREMLDRKRLDSVAGMSGPQKEASIVAAMGAWMRLEGAAGNGEIAKIASSDPSMSVRAAAAEMLRTPNR